MSKKILLGLTTVTREEWRSKVREIDELGIREISLFPTCLNINERQELYQLLEKTKLEKIPHVHLRSDMELAELDYFADRFKTKIFNIHSEKSSHPCLADYAKYHKDIYVENMEAEPPTENDLKKYAGLCIDLSHWESGCLLRGPDYKGNIRMLDLAQRHKIGVNHISAIKPKPFTRHDESTDKDFYHYGSHWLENLGEMDYVKKYRNYLADIISIELENSLKRQMEVKKYLERILEL